jgi:uncharacterized protein (TIGR02466 family)
MILDFYTNKIFPTKIMFKDLLDDSEEYKKILNLELKTKIETLTKDAVYLNLDTWNSSKNLHQKEEFKEITILLERLLDGVYATLNIASTPKIKEMWANINYPGGYETIHTNPNSKFSGVYYVNIPEQSGNIFFKDPRSGAELLKPNYVDYSEDFLSKQTFFGKEGMVFIFPSWLPYGVETNKSNLKRISISFNVD